MFHNWALRTLPKGTLYKKEVIFAGVLEPDPYPEPSNLPFPDFDPLFNISDDKQIQHFMTLCDLVEKEEWLISIDCWLRSFALAVEDDNGTITGYELDPAFFDWAKSSPHVIMDSERVASIQFEATINHLRFDPREETK
mmetsp:Transcript_9668/g.14715  ORF Transcript_9668/g.14715 Transcript_9668/m.14715 type:complete len:139 (+) Transcript_9668:2006-2422(+)